MEIVNEEYYSRPNEKVKIRKTSQRRNYKSHKHLKSRESCNEFFSRVGLSQYNIYFKIFKSNFK